VVLPEATHRVSFLAEANLSEVESSDFNPRASSGDAFTVVWKPLERFHVGIQELDPIPQLKATAKLGEFLESRFSQSF
jgi:hypothetical protein